MWIKDKTNIRKRQLQAWKELMVDINPNAADCDDELFLLDVWQEIELVHEAISISRKECRYSQEKLSENICEPESMSRIETGKRAPHKSTYRKVAQKLSLPEDYYFTNIETDDFGVLELQWELETLIMRQKWSEVSKVFERLRKNLNLESVKNRQYVAEIQYDIDDQFCGVPIESRLEYLTTILKYTMPWFENFQWNTNKFWKHYFTKEEMMILLKIADVLFVTDRKEEEILLLENMLQYYKKSRVSQDYHYRTVLLIVVRLTSVYSALLNYEKALECAEEGIHMSLFCGNMKLLASIVNNKADTLECLGHKEASLKYYRLAFYCAELMDLSTAEVSKRSYEKLLGKPMEWY